LIERINASFLAAGKRRRTNGASNPAAQQKKEQGKQPCSKYCVDPISPKIWI
jgi:hypothetical protein